MTRGIKTFMVLSNLVKSEQRTYEFRRGGVRQLKGNGIKLIEAQKSSNRLCIYNQQKMQFCYFVTLVKQRVLMDEMKSSKFPKIRGKTLVNLPRTRLST